MLYSKLSFIFTYLRTSTFEKTFAKKISRPRKKMHAQRAFPASLQKALATSFVSANERAFAMRVTRAHPSLTSSR